MAVNIVFFGSSEYSVIILKKLLEIPDFNITTVVTKLDKPVGRDQVVTPNPVSSFVKTTQIPLLQPEEFDKVFIKEFNELNPDLALVVAYGPPYFTQEMIDIPKYKVINIHPSPLPKYRGATPGPWQIINGEDKSAVTFFQIDALPDHGPIIKQIPFSIESADTAESFYQKSFRIAADNLEDTIKAYVSNPKNIFTQNHSEKTYYPKFTKESAQINWQWEPEKIERFVRALTPWPIAWTYVKNQHQQKLKMKIFSATLESGNLIPKNVQIEGKNLTSWRELDKYYQIIKN